MNGVDIGITSNVSIRVVNGDNGEYKEILSGRQKTGFCLVSIILGLSSLLQN